MPRRRSPASDFLMPLLPRRRGILFPNTTGAILIGRRTTLRAIDEATNDDAMVAVVTQRDPSLTEITSTTSTRTPPRRRSSAPCACPTARRRSGCRPAAASACRRSSQTDPYYIARVEPIEDTDEATVATEALRRAVLALFEKVARLAPSIPEDAYVMAMNIEQPGWLADFVASSLNLDDERGRRTSWRRSTRASGSRRSASTSRKSWTCWSCRARSTRACRKSSTSRSASTSCANR